MWLYLLHFYDIKNIQLIFNNVTTTQIIQKYKQPYQLTVLYVLLSFMFVVLDESLLSTHVLEYKTISQPVIRYFCSTVSSIYNFDSFAYVQCINKYNNI